MSSMGSLCVINQTHFAHIIIISSETAEVQCEEGLTHTFSKSADIHLHIFCTKKISPLIDSMNEEICLTRWAHGIAACGLWLFGRMNQLMWDRETDGKGKEKRSENVYKWRWYQQNRLRSGDVKCLVCTVVKASLTWVIKFRVKTLSLAPAKAELDSFLATDEQKKFWSILLWILLLVVIIIFLEETLLGIAISQWDTDFYSGLVVAQE